jgi:hypothetical protein
LSDLFRRNKELESDIRRLRELTSGLTRDEELLRELYIKMVEKCVLSALGKQNSQRHRLNMELDLQSLFELLSVSEVGSVCFGPPGSGSGSISQMYGSESF